MGTVHVLVGDPLRVVAAGLEAWLRDAAPFRFAGHCGTGNELLDRLAAQACELVLLEVSLPGLDGIDTMRAIHARFPLVKVLAFSALTEIEYVNSMLIEGAHGYLVKNTDRAELLLAMEAVLRGERYLSAAVRTSIEQGYAFTGKRMDGEYVGLTMREREIIRMVALERTNGEIAAALFISEETVKTHRKNLMTKLNVRSVAGLVKYAIDRRWV
ncbi:MAG: response regulator transcription factor [Flavobacteriales bacterium]|nr:response regulator transcription factor [Flavobacteriales bacterium]